MNNTLSIQQIIDKLDETIADCMCDLTSTWIMPADIPNLQAHIQLLIQSKANLEILSKFPDSLVFNNF